MPGAIGATGSQRVFKGTRMAGRMGGDQVTVHNLEVIEVDAAQGTIAIKGAVPGAHGSVIAVYGGYSKKQAWN
jgi:large subunit ribosomal protein L3